MDLLGAVVIGVVFAAGSISMVLLAGAGDS